MPADSSCGCIKLKFLVLFIGCLEVVASAFGIIISSVLLVYMDRFESKVLYRNVAIITMTVCVLALSVGFFLINGVRKVDRTQLKPWIVIKGILLCFYIGVLCLTVWLAHLKPEHPWIKFGVVWVEVAVIAFSYLSLMVVRMYYRVMPRYVLENPEIETQTNGDV